MKAGKRPTVAQRRFIEEITGLLSVDWLVTKDTPDHMEIVHRELGKVRQLVK